MHGAVVTCDERQLLGAEAHVCKVSVAAVRGPERHFRSRLISGIDCKQKNSSDETLSENAIIIYASSMVCDKIVLRVQFII